MVKRSLALLLVVAGLPLLGSKCEGDGSGGKPPTRLIRATDCAPLVEQFPPGFDWLPGDSGHAIAVGLSYVFFFDMNGDKPEALAPGGVDSVPPDSDGDGVADQNQRLCPADPISKFTVLGEPLGVSEKLGFVGGSGFEQVMFFEPPFGDLTRLEVINPPDTMSGSYYGEDYPYLPADSALRTAITTKACIYLTDGPGLTSIGDAVGQDPCCDRRLDVPSFFTAFTADMTLAAGHLFVATSNLDLPKSFLGRFFPGTVLVYDFDGSTDPPEIKPNVDTPVLFTTGFNPTGVSHYVTPLGRELVFITNSGAVGQGVGQTNILTDSFIDVIDAASRRLVATIPMGRAGLSFDGLAIDPAQRIAMTGSSALPVLYAIDLRVFDDEQLYAQSDLVWLDGSDPDFDDARIFDADNPFEMPDRADGPHPILCDGWTFVAINEAGESAYALERCDGTLSEINLLNPVMSCQDAGGNAACCDDVPLPRSCFSLGSVRNLTEPYNTATSRNHGPSQISVRPGEPGIDFTGPDLFFTVDLPDGELCPLRVDAF